MGASMSTALKDAGMPDDYNCAMMCAGTGGATDGAAGTDEAGHGT